ncbi:hypothetical protein GCM10020256_70970 [Streptomyces thermocoprophilus]
MRPDSPGTSRSARRHSWSQAVRWVSSRPSQSGGVADAGDGGVQRIADRGVAGGVQGDRLVDGGDDAFGEFQPGQLDGARVGRAGLDGGRRR